MRAASIRSDGKAVDYKTCSNRPQCPAAQTNIGQAPSLACRHLSSVAHVVVSKDSASTCGIRVAFIHRENVGGGNKKTEDGHRQKMGRSVVWSNSWKLAIGPSAKVWIRRRRRHPPPHATCVELEQ